MNDLHITDYPSFSILRPYFFSSSHSRLHVTSCSMEQLFPLHFLIYGINKEYQTIQIWSGRIHKRKMEVSSIPLLPCFPLLDDVDAKCELSSISMSSTQKYVVKKIGDEQKVMKINISCMQMYMGTYILVGGTPK